MTNLYLYHAKQYVISLRDLNIASLRFLFISMVKILIPSWKTCICLHFLKHAVKTTSQFYPFARQKIIIIIIKIYKINLEKYLSVGKCSNLSNTQRGRGIVYLKTANTLKLFTFVLTYCHHINNVHICNAYMLLHRSKTRLTTDH